MRNSLALIYCSFSVLMFCMALTLLIFIFTSLNELEKNVANKMYQQHVISCEIVRAG